MNIKGHISQSILIYSLIPLLYIEVIKNYQIFNDVKYSIANIIVNSFYLPYIIDNQDIKVLLYQVLYIVLVLLGAKIPDLDLKLKYLYPKGTPRYIYHRQITHSLLLNIGIFLYSLYSNNIYLFYIEVGILSHLLGDILTGSIPITLYGYYYSYWSRIGIYSILPKKVAVKISKKIVKIADKYYYIVIIVAILIYSSYFF